MSTTSETSERRTTPRVSRGAPTAVDQTWLIGQDGLDPARERQMETLFALGNGYLGVRGSLPAPLPSSQADMLVAGIYADKAASFPYSEVAFKAAERGSARFVELAPLPFPFRLSVKVDGVELTPRAMMPTVFERVLDMQRATLHVSQRYRDDTGGVTELRSRCCVSLADRHLLLQSVEVDLGGRSGVVEIDASILADDAGGGHPHFTVKPLAAQNGLAELTRFQTRDGTFVVAVAASLSCNGEPLSVPAVTREVHAGETLRLQRMVDVRTSRDSSEPESMAVCHLGRRDRDEWHEYWEQHEAAWSAVWQCCDVEFAERPELTQAQRFNLYQLRIGIDHDPQVSLGARGLSGRAYEGHVFWDTEIFALPVFQHTEPQVARSLLEYRYHTLGGAKERANDMGYEGACYAWESTVTGEDVTPRQIVIETTGIVVPIFTGTQQIHVTADVAHAVWHYWRATRDDAFLASCGAEMLVETARFWASRAVERDGAHHIDRVVGPDEYHHDVNDNAYTNWMAKENLRAAVDALGWLETHAPRAHGELTARLGVGRHHVERWQDVAARLYIPAPDARGVIEQFAGFFDLQEVPLPAGERLRAPISRLMDWETINRTKICKQADVLMIPFLFPAVLPPDVVKACFHYYEPITDHGSSLSPAVHAAVAARLGLRDRALDYWETSLLLDLENRMGNTALGFHVASAGGAWQALIFHLLGLRFEEGRIERDSRLTPVLPDGCSAVRGRLVHRGRHLPFDVRPQEEREGRP